MSCGAPMIFAPRPLALSALASTSLTWKYGIQYDGTCGGILGGIAIIPTPGFLRPPSPKLHDVERGASTFAPSDSAFFTLSSTLVPVTLDSSVVARHAAALPHASCRRTCEENSAMLNL